MQLSSSNKFDPVSHSPLTSSAALNAVELRDRMRAGDLDLFAAVVTPEECTEPFSAMHKSIWLLLTQAILRGERLSRHGIGIPRGHAKTHMLKLLCCYTVMFTDLKYALVVCNTIGLARNFVNDVMDMMLSDNVVTLFGDFRDSVEKNNETEKIFWFAGREVILKPLGCMNAVRGTVIKRRRPELIICDDMQSREESMSPEISRTIHRWFYATLFKARSYARAHFIYVGNMYPDVPVQPSSEIMTCLLRNLQRNSKWTTWISGAILEDGSVVWPEVHPLENLLEDLEQDKAAGLEDVWYAEVQNDPEARPVTFFDADKVQEFPYPTEPGLEPIPYGKFFMIDPSLGKRTSDLQPVGLFHVYDERGPVLQEVRIFQCSGPKLVEGVLIWALEEEVPLIVAEAYGYQESLLQWFTAIAEAAFIEGITFAPIRRPSTGTMTKNTAISGSFKLLYGGKLFIHPQAWPFYSYQAKEFIPTRTNNSDDVLDMTEYGRRIFDNMQDLWLKDFSAIKKRERPQRPGTQVKELRGMQHNFRTH